MTVSIQIRNVPDELHCLLKSRAAAAGMSMSAYLLREIREIAERPTMEEMRARLERLSETSSSISSADEVRAHRGRL